MIVRFDVELTPNADSESLVVSSYLVGAPSCHPRLNLTEQVEWVNVEVGQDSVDPHRPGWRLTSVA
jgi:hypothetical protein